MVVTDPRKPDNPIIFVNDAFLAMTRYSKEEVIGRNCRFLNGADTDPGSLEEIRSAIAEGRESSTEILNYRKDGSTFWNSLFIAPIPGNDGKPMYFFASQLDVSRRRDAEQTARQAQKMDALGQMTGTIAHDFNNLLQIMTGYLDLLQLQGKGRASDAMLDSLGKINGAVEKATLLSRQLLAFSRRQPVRGRVVNLNSSLSGVTELAKRALGDEVKFKIICAPSLWNCRIDTPQFEVAMLNLLINSRDALTLRPNDGAVTIQTANVELLERQVFGRSELEPGRYAAVSISDNGAGISPNVIDHVMEPFYTTKAEGKGTGLGLSMVGDFVRESGGALHLYSEIGLGTTIRFYFPAVTDDMETNAASASPANVEPDGRGNILIVEDRAEVGEVAEAIISQMGYTTLRVRNAVEALSVLQSTGVDLLFSDLVMPGGMDGVQLAREAKRLRPRIKILLTTGFALDATERPDASGVSGIEFDIIEKPYRRIDLGVKLRVLLEGPTGAG
jgi:PAS domain S-box-containing protein